MRKGSTEGSRRGRGWRWNDRSGAAATEMALVMPLLYAMLMGVLEFGCVLYSYSAMQLGANRLARSVAVNTMTPVQADSAVAAYLPTWLQGHVTVAISESAPGNPTLNLINLRLTTSFAEATPLAIFTRATSWPLVTEVTVKQELPYVD